MAPLTLDSRIDTLGIKPQTLTALGAGGIETVRQLISKTRVDIAKLDGLGDSRLAAIDAILATHRLCWNDERALLRTCTKCPACPDCGNPRAVDRRNVTTQFGRYKHIGLSAITEPCDGCNDYHRALFGLLPAAAQTAAA